ncbi:MAG: hypothetical protein L6R39_003098 [Caloplaca ligustica]|nr:MAG: hypothetical protein L6R39_003098 [Caloplaca ligustica]
MAEAVAVISFISAVISLVDAGTRIVNRLHEFDEASQEIPESFRHLKSQLPIVLDGLRRTEARAKAGHVDKRTQEALVPTIQGCRDRVASLYNVLDGVLPSKTDSSLERAMKAVKSVSKDKKVQKLLKDIDSYLTSLTFHNTSGDSTSISQAKPMRRVNMAPADRDKNFVDRPQIFRDLDATMKEYGRAAIAGIGGVGKTQIAVEQCYRFLERIPSSNVLWVHAGSVTKLVQSCKDICDRLQLPGCSDPQSDTLRILHAWLGEEANGNWMIVVDNADDLDLLEQRLPSETGPKTLLQLIPQRPHGKVVVTTRDRRVGERLAVRGRTVIVPPMSLREGRTLLASYLPTARDYEKGGLDELVETLDCLPLAISQAAAYMTENYMDVADYMALLDEGGDEMEALLSESFSDARRGEAADNSVLKTWKLSFDQITHRFSRAADMLSLMSMFDRQGVPEDLLRREGEPRHIFINALATLQNFSLVSRTTDGKSYYMHRLIQIAVKTWLQLKGTLSEWEGAATDVLSIRFPSGEYETWSACATLVPHVRAVLDLERLPRASLLRRSQLLHKVAWFDRLQDRWQLSHDRAKEAAIGFEQMLGPDAPETLSSKITAADSLIELEKPREAEECLMDILPSMERVLGPDHIETLRNKGNQGWAKFRYGDFERADAQLREVAQARERTLGFEHPATLLAYNNVAVNASTNYAYDPNYSNNALEAVALGRKVLAARQHIFGPKHIDVLETQGNLGNFLDNVGNYEEAEKYYKSAIAARDELFGPGNPWALTLMHNLAVCYSNCGNYAEALEIDKVVLSSRIKVLGEEHIDTLMSRHNLVVELVSKGEDWEEVALQSRLILNYRDAIENTQRPFTSNLIPDAESYLQQAYKHLEVQAMEF